MIIQARVASARDRLRQVGIQPDEADLDARVLAEHELGWDAAKYFTDANEEEPGGFGARYEALVARRAAREPVAYITGEREFWNLTFEVSPAVLIPRPETELIVEAALELLTVPTRGPDRLRQATADRGSDANDDSRAGHPVHPAASNSAIAIADACTGSGCLAVVLAHELSEAQVVATDLSDPALEVALRNARRHGVDGRIRFVRTDTLETTSGPFDLIVSNPPYVPESDLPTLPPEVREYEPPMAYLAPESGLAVVRRLVLQAPPRLKPGGVLIFEFGFGQADAISALISATPGLTMVGLRRDLQGISRIMIASATDTVLSAPSLRGERHA